MTAVDDYGIEPLTAGQQIVFAHTANNVSGVLAVACGASDTTISLSPGGGALFPAAPFYVSIEFEVLWCLSKSGDNLIVQRGQDGTTATSHAVGLSVEMRNNAGLWTDAYNGINSVSADVGTLQTNITNKTALPPDTTFAGNTQELTHKTIDLADSAKGNVILGNVSPDPSQLVYQNILNNGGFEEWTYGQSLTLAAGTPTSGSRSMQFANYWRASGTNDSSITCARDTANIDPGNPSGVDCLINITTVQAADSVGITQYLMSTDIISWQDAAKMQNCPVSIQLRAKAISGNPSISITLYHVDSASGVSGANPSYTPLTTSYATYKLENVILIPSSVNLTTLQDLLVIISFKGVGQLALDNIMMNVGSVSTQYRPKILPISNPANLLINGGFENWQRGNGPFTMASQSYGPDAWNGYLVGTDTISVSKTAGSPDTGSAAAAVCSFTLGSGAGASQIRQIIQTDSQNLRTRTLTFQARVNCNTPNAVRISIGSDGTAPVSNYNASPYHPGDSVYHTLTVTTQVPSDITYVVVLFYFNASCTAYLDNAILYDGQFPAKFTEVNPGDDLSRCLRRYQKWNSGGGNQRFAFGQTASATIVQMLMLPLAQMLVLPSWTFNTPSSYGIYWGGATPTVTAIAYTQQLNTGTLINVTFSGAGPAVGNSVQVIDNSQASFIAAEANP